MGLKFAAALLAISLAGWAQMTMTVDQLVDFIRSAVKLKQDDRQVANYLRKVRLTNKLDDPTIEDLQSLGAGPKTVIALRDLRDATAGLKPAPPPKPEPVYTPPPPPDSITQKEVLHDATENVLNYEKGLPDFMCTQVTRRYLDPSGTGDWRRTDIITERLSYFEHREDYKVILVNSQMVDIPHDRLGGAVSSGEWASIMKEIFAPETETTFEWERWTTLRGDRMHVYTYKVRSSKSTYHIIVHDQGLNIITAYHGLIYVDNKDHFVHRITLQAEGIPAGFPIQDVNLQIDYDYAKIADREFLLPLKFQLHSREGRLQVRNDVEYTLYRKFGAETTITFDTPDPIPDEKTKETPVTQSPKPDPAKPPVKK